MRPATRHRRALLVGALLLGIIPFVTVGGIRLYLAFNPRARLGFTEHPPRIVEIPAGIPAREVAARLKAEGVLPNRWLFLTLATLRGTADTLKAGEYRFHQPMAPVDVIRMIQQGEVYLHPLTFPEGLTIAEMAKLFEAGGFGTAAFLAFLMNVCQKEHATVQYAFLSSVFSLTGRLIGGISGLGAERFGYGNYFAITFLLAMPAYLLLPWVRYWIKEERRE